MRNTKILVFIAIVFLTVAATSQLGDASKGNPFHKIMEKLDLIVQLLEEEVIPQLGCETVVGVPKTGQKTSYAAGDDGDLEAGIAWPAPRFTNNGNTGTDNLTGLMWIKDANCIASNYSTFDNDGTAGDGRVTWYHALDFISGINDGTFADCGAGYSDWRLANVNELLSLIDYSVNAPALMVGHPFDNVQASHYWSSTMSAGGGTAWWVYFGGGVGTNTPSNYYYVWPVRGGN